MGRIPFRYAPERKWFMESRLDPRLFCTTCIGGGCQSGVLSLGPEEQRERILEYIGTDPHYRAMAEALVQDKGAVTRMCQALAARPLADIVPVFSRYIGTAHEKKEAPKVFLERAASLPALVSALEGELKPG